MRLTKAEIKRIEDAPRIQEVLKGDNCICYMVEVKGRGNGKRCSKEKAIEILGREKFLSGIERAAFHWDSIRYNDDESIAVVFDAKRFFEERIGEREW